MKYAFPANYGEDCILVPIDAALVPIVAGALIHFQLRGYWKTEADYEQGYNAFAELQADMSGRCIVDLIESNNRIYRLLSTTLLGTEYTVTPAVSPLPALPADPTRPTITPALPDAPPTTAPALLPVRAMLNRQLRLLDLVDNALNGTVIDAAPTLQPSVRDNLEAVRMLLETANTSDIDIEGLISTIILALA